MDALSTIENDREHNDYWRTALVVSTLINLAPGRHGKSLGPEDVMPALRTKQEPLPVETQAALFASFIGAHNAGVKGGN